MAVSIVCAFCGKKHDIPSDSLMLRALLEGQGELMSKISDFTAQVAADFAAEDTKLNAVIAGIADLDAAIVSMKASAGQLSVLDQASLDNLAKLSSALRAKVAGIDTSVPVDAPVDVPPAPPAGPPAE